MFRRQSVYDAAAACAELGRRQQLNATRGTDHGPSVSLQLRRGSGAEWGSQHQFPAVVAEFCAFRQRLLARIALHGDHPSWRRAKSFLASASGYAALNTDTI